MKKIFLCAVLLLAPFFVHAGGEFYGGFNTGFTEMSESSGAAFYKHTSTFFIGHFGFSVGGRARYEIQNFGLGVVGELSWIGDSLERKQTGVINDATYRDESYRLLGGASVSYKTGSLILIGEYYPTIQNTFTYADEKSENLFRKNDKLSGTGYGVGFNYILGQNVGYNVIVRDLSYTKLSSNGVETTLPNTQYSAFRTVDILVALSLGI